MNIVRQVIGMTVTSPQSSLRAALLYHDILLSVITIILILRQIRVMKSLKVKQIRFISLVSSGL